MKAYPLLLPALFLAAPADAQPAPYDDAGMRYGHVHLSVADVEVHEEPSVEQLGCELVELGPLAVVESPGTLVTLR